MDEPQRAKASRWQSIKSKKSNLALLIAGVALVLLAPIWHFAVAPALKVVPTDIDMLRSYQGTMRQFARPPGQGAGAAATYNILVEQREFNPLGASTPEVAVLELDTSFIDTAGHKRLTESRTRYAVDRRSAKQVKDGVSARPRGGYFLVFPFNTPKADIPVWDDATGRPQVGVFSGKTTYGGVSAYVFKEEYSDQPLASPPPGFPARMTGAQMKQMLGAQVAGVADTDVITADYRGSLATEFLVEPVSGSLVGIREASRTESVLLKDLTNGLALGRDIEKLDVKETVTSLSGGASFASEEIKKIRLQYEYIPLGLLALGIACALIGAFAGVKDRESRG